MGSAARNSAPSPRGVPPSLASSAALAADLRTACRGEVGFDARNRALYLDPERRLARVQLGLILDHLRDAVERHHLAFSPDPATHDHCAARRHDRE